MKSLKTRTKNFHDNDRLESRHIDRRSSIIAVFFD